MPSALRNVVRPSGGEALTHPGLQEPCRPAGCSGQGASRGRPLIIQWHVQKRPGQQIWGRTGGLWPPGGGARAGGPSRHKLSFWGDKNLLKLAYGDGHIIGSENTLGD